MPSWVTRLTTVGQILGFLAAMGVILVLALNRIIDGATTIATLLIAMGISGSVAGVAHIAESKTPVPPVDSPYKVVNRDE